MNARCYPRGVVVLMLLCLPLVGGAEEPDRQSDSAGLPLQLPERPPKSAFDGILERPLFSETRAPQLDTNTAQPVNSARDIQEQWKLTGIIMAGEQMTALLRQRNGMLHQQLHPGMPLDDAWVLREIHDTSVVLAAGDTEVRLQLLEPRDTAPLTSDSPQSTDSGPESDTAPASSESADPKEVPNE